MLNYFPKYLANTATVCYIVALLVVSMLFFDAAIPLWLMLFGVVTVPLFFYGSNHLTKAWGGMPQANFATKLFWGAFAIRFAYVIFIYYFNNAHYGHYYESNPGDIGFYVECGELMAKYALGMEDSRGMTWVAILSSWNVQFSDMGYILYLGFLYMVTNMFSAVVLPLILKAAMGAATCVFLYRIAARHFGETTGRMAGIFCMLQFNMIWWCGSMMKETEMIFLFVCFAENADKISYKEKASVWNWILAIVLGLSLFTFRTALGMVAFLALFCQVVFASDKVTSIGKKIAVGVVFLAVVLIMFRDTLAMEIANTQQMSAADYQQTNMEWRSQRAGGNAFAKYAGAAIFAPLIFTIPFPTVVYTMQDQEMLMMVAGGNYVKNVLSFFVIAVMFFMLFKGRWREHVFPIALLCGYLAALVLSVFAQSGRFHLPIIPLEMMFAAYGVSLMQNKHKRWFNYVLVFEFFVIIAWSWFKLAGRGMA